MALLIMIVVDSCQKFTVKNMKDKHSFHSYVYIMVNLLCESTRIVQDLY